MQLEQYLGKAVLLESSSGSYVGMVSDYFSPEDNESSEESIVLETKSGSTEFSASEIFSIKVI